MSSRLFVGGLSWNIDSAKLRQIFEAVGVVKDAIVIIDKESGRSKGFGFVEMADAADAEKAMNTLSGTEIDGRKIGITEARPRA